MRYNQPFGVTDADSPYINGDPSQGRKGSIIPAEAVEYPQRELVALTDYAGFVPDNDDLVQTTRAVRQGVNYIVASAAPEAVNNLIVTLDPPLDQYRAGLVLRVKMPYTNTGAATLNVNELGIKNIIRGNGAASAPGDLIANAVVALVYDGAAFQILNFFGISGPTNVNNYLTEIPYVEDVGTVVNHLIAPFAPAITALTPGLAVLVKMGTLGSTPNTDIVDIKVNNNAIVPVIRPDLKDLGPGDIIPGMIALCVFDGSAFQMISMPASAQRILTAPMTYYVNAATGQDNPRWGRTPQQPFLTINYALSQMVLWVNRGYTFTIVVANGTYGRTNCPAITGGGSCDIVGNMNNPEQCVIYDNVGSAGNTEAIVMNDRYTLRGFKLQSNAGYGLVASGNVSCGIASIDFGYCPAGHIIMWAGANVTCFSQPPAVQPNAFLHISGSAQAFIIMNGNCSFTMVSDVYPMCDLIITANVTINYFINANDNCACWFWFRGIGGSQLVNGTKYALGGNSALNCGGHGVNYVPGQYPGVVSSGAVAYG
jgi:hypothetical protein